MHKITIAFLMFIIIYIFPISVSAVESFIASYVTIKFNRVNARTGPNQQCPIKWVFIKKNEPVEVIAEYDQWKKIRDINGEGGWVHSRVLSNSQRSVILISQNIESLITNPSKSCYRIVAQVMPQMRCRLIKCKKQWCKVDCKSYQGWFPKKFLWGVYSYE